MTAARFRIAPVGAAVGVFAVSAVVDAPWPPALALAAAGLGVWSGFMAGGVFALAELLLVRLGAAARAVWILAGIAAGLWLASSLGAFFRLDGPYASLARLALLGSLVWGGGLGVATALCQRPHARWAGHPAFVVLLVGGAACLAAGDRLLLVGQAPQLHEALRQGARWMAALAIASAAVHVPLRPSARALAWVSVCVLAVLPLLLIDQDHEGRAAALLERPYAGLDLRAARALVDLDRDGFSSLLAGGDCDDLDDSRNPGAAEIPGNGIDDNCMLGDARLVEPGPMDVPIPQAPSAVSVVLVTMDSVRPDHLPPWGGARDTAPHLTAWAREATIFDDAVTPGCWTTIAVSSMNRGALPRRLDWFTWIETSSFRLLAPPIEGKLRPDERPGKLFLLPASGRWRPLPWWLQRRGMKTAAVVDDGQSEFLGADVGTAEGFDTFLLTESLGPDASDRGTVDLALDFLTETPPQRPFFLWVHLYGPHEPDRAHPEVPSWGTSTADRYDHEIRWMDEHLGRLLDAIEARKGLPLLTIVASDHGEKIGPTSRAHGHGVDEETLRIPLAIRGPGFGAAHVSAPVSLLDVFATVLAATGTPGPPNLDGVDLRSPPPDRILLGDCWRVAPNGSPLVERVVALNKDNRVVLDRLTNAIYVEARRAGEPSPGAEDAASLRDALFRYLEETGGVPRVVARP